MPLTKMPKSHLIYEANNDSEPIISILIPTFKRNSMLAQALASSLNQDASCNFEVIVVDNDPESFGLAFDNFMPIKKNICLRYFVNEINLGMTGNWNQCLELAKGNWVTMLHDDDWLAPNFISTMLPLLLKGFNFAVCKVDVGDLSYNPLKINQSRDSSMVFPITHADLIMGNPTPAPGLLILRKILDDVGRFNDGNYPCADYVTYILCAKKSKSVMINRTLAYYRRTDSQTFKDNTLELMFYKSLEIKQSLLRRYNLFDAYVFVLSAASWINFVRKKNIAINFPSLNAKLIMALALSKSDFFLYLLGGTRNRLKKFFRPSLPL